MESALSDFYYYYLYIEYFAKEIDTNINTFNSLFCPFINIQLTATYFLIELEYNKVLLNR